MWACLHPICLLLSRAGLAALGWWDTHQVWGLEEWLLSHGRTPAVPLLCRTPRSGFGVSPAARSAPCHDIAQGHWDFQTGPGEPGWSHRSCPAGQLVLPWPPWDGSIQAPSSRQPLCSVPFQCICPGVEPTNKGHGASWLLEWIEQAKPQHLVKHLGCS